MADSTTLHRYYRVRTLREKVVFEADSKGRAIRVLSRKVLQSGPTAIGDWDPEDSPWPTLNDSGRRQRNEVGKWSRLMKAVKRFGLDGDEDNGE